MEELLAHYARIAARLIEAGAVLIVVFGCIEAFAALVRMVVAPRGIRGERKAIWLRLAGWLIFGLEFELAADIVASVISPTWHDIGQLAAIGAIRTFLNYFLERDLEEADTIGARTAAASAG